VVESYSGGHFSFVKGVKQEGWMDGEKELGLLPAIKSKLSTKSEYNNTTHQNQV
jgi:hypothetical protein